MAALANILGEGSGGGASIFYVVLLLAVWGIRSLAQLSQSKKRPANTPPPQPAPLPVPRPMPARSVMAEKGKAPSAPRRRQVAPPPLPKSARSASVPMPPLPPPRTSRRPQSSVPQAAAPTPRSPKVSFESLSRRMQPNVLRWQFVLTEIIRPPVALRDDEERR